MHTILHDYTGSLVYSIRGCLLLYFELLINKCILLLLAACNVGTPTMKERSSLCDSAADGNWVSKFKRKRSKLTASSSNEHEATSPTSDSLMNNGSIKKRSKHDTSISTSAKKIRGHDGVNSFSFYQFITCQYILWILSVIYFPPIHICKIYFDQARRLKKLYD